ncbi:hypothetical protein FQR65_LT19355 [Abscondita terminalis]|nr:hypothetical protein FQR65_LT19355 [Abscondita terminalis]
MKITNKNHDEVSALLTVTLDKSDYKEKVEKTLLNYAKNANIPALEGKAPLSLIRRQYEAGVAYEEINKQVSDALNNYINENNLRISRQRFLNLLEALNYNNDNISVAFEDNKEVYALVKGKKVDESVMLTKEDLEKDEVLAKELGFAQVEHLHHNEVKVTVKDIYSLNLAELNQELFDKVYGSENIKSEEELKNKQIVEKEEIQLPEAFLIKWLMFNNQNIQSEEQAKEILENEKAQLKYQIIEGKLMNDNDVKIDYADILAQSEQLKYAVEMLKDEEQVRQISSEVANELNERVNVSLKREVKKRKVAPLGNNKDKEYHSDTEDNNPYYREDLYKQG